ncbi:MAG: uroporphyrinogen-III synthase [Gammaproteobacteria bacterium]|nr:uroporphyrinogen-III synthase [Gammaproteobacteria bacterium]
MNNNPDIHRALQGITVLVTRPEPQNLKLKQLIEQAGGKAILFPVLEILPVTNTSKAVRQLSAANHWDWIIFTSVNAVNHALEICHNQLPLSLRTHIAAIGKATARSLQSRQIKVDLIPPQSSSEGLLQSLVVQLNDKSRCLIIKGEGGRSLLRTELTNKGVQVDTVDVYRRTCPGLNPSSLLEQWSSGGIDYVVVNSVETLTNLVQIIETAGLALLKDTMLIALSKRVQHAAEKIELSKTITAIDTSDNGIIETLVKLQNNGLKNTSGVQSH